MIEYYSSMRIDQLFAKIILIIIFELKIYLLLGFGFSIFCFAIWFEFFKSGKLFDKFDVKSWFNPLFSNII
jgi:hypothetical protein